MTWCQSDINAICDVAVCYSSSAEIWVAGTDVSCTHWSPSNAQAGHRTMLKFTYYISSFTRRDIILYRGYRRRRFTSIFLLLLWHHAIITREFSFVPLALLSWAATLVHWMLLSSLPPTLHVFLLSMEEMPGPWERGSCSAAPVFKTVCFGHGMFVQHFSHIRWDTPFEPLLWSWLNAGSL